MTVILKLNSCLENLVDLRLTSVLMSLPCFGLVYTLIINLRLFMINLFFHVPLLSFHIAFQTSTYEFRSTVQLKFKEVDSEIMLVQFLSATYLLIVSRKKPFDRAPILVFENFLNHLYYR